jgi:CRP/FNR family transcriptional regulator, cyclic AMP receptor protein
MLEEQFLKQLHKLPLFKGLTEIEMSSIVSLSGTRRYKSGMHVFMQGDPVENVYFIHEGRIKVYKTDFQGREQIVNVLQPGDMFPHQGFFRKGNYPAHSEVVEDAVITFIPINSFENFLIQNPEITIKLFRVLGDLIVDLQGRLEEKLLHNTHEQIVLLLLRLAKMHGEDTEDGWRQLHTQFTNQELANMIGTSRETVNRSISKLKKQNMVRVSDKHFLVLDVERLADETT